LATPPPPLAPEAPRPRAYHVKPILATLLGGILLAGGSCAGFLSTVDMGGVGLRSRSLETLYVAGFFAGGLAVLAGGVWAIAAIIVFFIRAASGEQ